MRVDWNLLANILVAVGTFSLAVTAFIQARHSLRGQQARAQAALADGVYLPVRIELEAISEAEYSRWAGTGSPWFREWPNIKKNQPLLSIQVPDRLRQAFDSVAAATKRHHEAVDEFYRLSTPRFATILGQEPTTWKFEAGLDVRFGPHASLSTSLSPRTILGQALGGGGLVSFLNDFERQYPVSELKYKIHHQQQAIAEGDAAIEKMAQVFDALTSMGELRECLASARSLAQVAAAAWALVQSELAAVAQLVQRHHA